MAAYAATVSLMHILHTLKNHPSPPISPDKQQFDSLTEIVTFLHEFLEVYVSPFEYSDEADPLEMRIADAVYAAEDVIESYIVDNIHFASASTAQEAEVHDDAAATEESYAVESVQLAAAATHHEDEQIRYINFYVGLQKVIESMDMIKKEVMAMEMKTDRGRGKGAMLEAEVQRNVSKSSSIESKIEMVGFQEELLKIKEKLTGGDSDREIIPIVGMGGIGKTTLARNIFADQLIKESFRIRLWATVSQDYNIEQTLREVLTQAIGGNSGDEMSVDNLGNELYQYLFGRKYLVVLDDMWNIEAWDKMRHFFPSHERNGSRIIVTTRMSNLAGLLSSSSNSLCVSFLNKVDSWTLFSKTVFSFGSEECVPELREIGEKIVERCKGLPLSIAVIGGLLAKSERTQGYWEYVEANLNSIVNTENEEYCSRVLKLSYNHLPVYLKPCFLYMGVFDEDHMIRESELIRLWISEGFLKTKKNKSMRTIAKERLKDLVDRNLIILERKAKIFGNEYIKYLKIHDLLRDLSLKEAEKQKFYHVLRQRSPHPMYSQRRIVIPKNTLERGVCDGLESRGIRSYLCYNLGSELRSSELLRTLNMFGRYPNENIYSLEHVLRFFSLRHLVIGVREKMIPSCIKMLWNLRTLIVHNWSNFIAPVEIWKMHQLEQVEVIIIGWGRFYIPHPPPPSEDDDMVIMKNLHSLKGVVDFDLNEDTVKRIPNIKKLDILYGNERVKCLSHLGCLRQLENLRLTLSASDEYMQRIKFPESLKKLTLKQADHEDKLELGDMVLQEIGSLPHLQELHLVGVVFTSSTWETIDGQFPNLRSLTLHQLYGLQKWTVSDSFQNLRDLNLSFVIELEEIPLEIGRSGKLISIRLRYCTKPLVESAIKILEEEEEMNGEQSNLHVQVYTIPPSILTEEEKMSGQSDLDWRRRVQDSEEEPLQGLSASLNFHVIHS